MAGGKSSGRNVNAGSNIRLEEPTSKNRRPSQSKKISKASGQIAVGFVNFVKNHAVVSLAVGFIIATQAQALIKQLVASFITPTFQLFFNGALAKDTVTFNINGRNVSYAWGAFVNELLNLIFIMLALYLIIKLFKLDKLDKDT